MLCLIFRPDFAQIDEIKDEICEALTSYSSKIEGFLKEMNEADQTCDMLREEIVRLRDHNMRVRADARCALTNRPVVGAGEPFYAFPSGYVYLASPLKDHVLPYLTERQRKRLEELLRHNTGKKQIDPAIQAEIDGLIAAECPLTGSIMVESIDKDFEDAEEIDASTLVATVERVEV